IVPSVATRILGFVAGKFDTVYGVTVPLLNDVKAQAPQAVCEVIPTNVPRTLLVNRAAPPFDNAELRRAMALTLDRKAFIDIITLGQGDFGAAMLPTPPTGIPRCCARTLPSASWSARTGSTIRISSSTRILPAARNAIMAATATPSSTV